jgi:ATP-dependent DNA ligase
MARTVARQRRNDAAALPQWVTPQLTQLVDVAPVSDQWLHEIKYDGYRMHARLDRGAVRSFADHKAWSCERFHGPPSVGRIQASRH